MEKPVITNDKEVKSMKEKPHILEDNKLKSNLWGIHGEYGMDFDKAWNIYKPHPSRIDPIIIAVFDTGVDYNNLDLQDRLWNNPNEINNWVDNDNNGIEGDYYGYNIMKNNGDVMDYDEISHGTLNTGIIGFR